MLVGKPDTKPSYYTVSYVMRGVWWGAKSPEKRFNVWENPTKPPGGLDLGTASQRMLGE